MREPSGESERSVVVVGNGPSMLGRDLGSRIDAFEEIVRFNLFVIGRHRRDVGSRTTIWFCNRKADHPAILRRLREHPVTEIHVHTWADETEAADSYRPHLAELGRRTSVEAVPKGLVAELVAYHGSGYRLFSTGAIAVWALLGRFRTVALVGFDWWEEGLPSLHYFADAAKPPDPATGHRPSEERDLFRRLEAAGRIRFL